MDVNLLSQDYIIRAKSQEDLIFIRKEKWLIHNNIGTDIFYIRTRKYKVRSGLSFTPYANASICNAACSFCSENLLRNNQEILSSEQLIENYDKYFESLKRILINIKSIKDIKLSISGLEATSNPSYLVRLLDVIFDKNTGINFKEKVLYTNSYGLYKYPQLIDIIIKYNFDRIEISRCHYDEIKNQKIMRFDKYSEIKKNNVFENLMKNINKRITVVNSCILNKEGICSVSEIEKYLDWMITLGSKQIAFRELSILDRNYKNNKTKIWIDKNRISSQVIVKQIMPNINEIRENWMLEHSKIGYYYYQESYIYKGKILVNIETSSYTQLESKNETEIIQKLIFHSNGNLSSNWSAQEKNINNYYTNG